MSEQSENHPFETGASEAAAQLNAIDAGDFAYHQRLAAELRDVQQAERTIAHLQRQIAATQGAARSWWNHLKNKYQLGAADEIDEAGKITRKPGESQ